jgi:hypothetical protein
MSSDCYAQARADYELEQVKKEAEESYEYEAPAPIANGLDIA